VRPRRTVAVPPRHLQGHHDGSSLSPCRWQVDETPKEAGHFAVDEVWNSEFLVAETIGFKVVRNKFDDDAGVDDSQSPRPSCNAVRIVSRSTSS